MEMTTEKFIVEEENGRLKSYDLRDRWLLNKTNSLGVANKRGAVGHAACKGRIACGHALCKGRIACGNPYLFLPFKSPEKLQELVFSMFNTRNKEIPGSQTSVNNILNSLKSIHV